MWRLFILFFMAQLVLAGTIEIKRNKYNIKENKITKKGFVVSTWGPAEKNQSVFELNMRGKEKYSFGVTTAGYMFQKLRSRTETELIPFPQPAFTKKLTFIVDSGDEPITSDQVIFRFEETTLIDSLKNLYTIEYFAMNKKELHEHYGITNNGLDLKKMDPAGDAKFIFAQDDSTVFYWNFFFYADDAAQQTKAEEIFQDAHSNISVPFVYGIQYQNSKETKTFERISQDSPFTVSIAKAFYELEDINEYFYVQLYGIILPQKFNNNTLTTEIQLASELGWYEKQRPQEVANCIYKISKILEFSKDDVIQIKLPNEWPGRIYKTAKGFSNNPVSNGIQNELVFDPKIGDQFITIKPIKIE